MLSKRTSRLWPGLTRALAVLLVAAGVCGGLASSAAADDFLLQWNDGTPVSFAKGTILGSQSPISTDGDGRLTIPYQGTVTEYQVTVTDLNGRQWAGRLIVNGMQGIKVVPLGQTN
jgi:hypothetical protein